MRRDIARFCVVFLGLFVLSVGWTVVFVLSFWVYVCSVVVLLFSTT